MSDFNPAFSFDFGQDDESHQAPWEFKGALEHAEKPTGTTIDFKIQRQRAHMLKNKQEEKSAADDDDDDDMVQEDEDDSEAEILEDNNSDEEILEEDDSDEEILEDDNSDEEILEGDDESDEEILEDDSDEEDAPVEKTYTTNKPQHASTLDQKTKEKKPNKNKEFYDATPQGTSFVASSFSDLNLSRPLIRACAALGYTQPTPIQAACIPLALTGRDICGSAITGSGKTAAFSLPLLERLLHRNKRVAATYVLVLTPTRELAVQVHSMIQKLAQFTDIQAALVVGGLSLQAQASALRAGPEIVVATPGRLIDHLRNSQGFGLEDLAALVLDEADRLLEMGFKEEINEIIRLSPSRRQSMLFSATMTEEVSNLIALSLRHPVRLAADAAAASPEHLTQEIIRLKGASAALKEAWLMALVSRSLASTGRTIIFFSTKQRAHRAKIVFGLCNLPPAAELHGDMTQAARLESLENFRNGTAAFLLATDVAARGLDIVGVQTVVNFDCPRDLAAYLHRVGRTARAGAGGRSITFAEDGDRKLVKDIIKKGKVDLQQRSVPKAAVMTWLETLERLEQDIIAIIYQEREERAIRKAEMEAEKASNMLQHEDEIYSRPARTWFQSTKEKKDAAGRAKAVELGFSNGDDLPADVAKKVAKNTAKSARRMERKQAAAEEDKKNKKSRNAPMEETNAVVGRVKAVKAREQALRQEGVPASKAGKIAAAMVSGRGGDQSKEKKRKKKNALVAGTNGLFDGDGIHKGSAGGENESQGKKNVSVYAGGAKSGKARAPASRTLAGAALSRVKRGGKGKHSFKSKAKHKRRK